MTKSLDLGCGSVPKNPFFADELFGVDIHEGAAPNIKSADLVVESIPYEDSSFDYVTAFDFIGQIPRIAYAPKVRNAFIELMNEVYRVLKPDGLFLSLTPSVPHLEVFSGPTNVNFITEETFTCYFDDTNRWAARFGFNGAFRVIAHEWKGSRIFAVLQKVEPPPSLSPVTRPTPMISVFIPVYNGENHIAETLESARNQTFDDFEIICIDDCSTDTSLSILRAYEAMDPRIRVFQTPINLGTAPKVLNYGLTYVQGVFFAYSSQDDLFSRDWLEKMYVRAISTGADAVIPDLVFYHARTPEMNRSLVGLNGDRNVVLTNREAVFYSLTWSIPGNALWRANLIKKIGFEEFAINSDEFSIRVFFLNCNKVLFSEGTFYYRQDNELAITKKISHKTFDYPYTQFRLYLLLKENLFPNEVIQQAALKVVEIHIVLNNWLLINRTVLTLDEIKNAESRLNQCRDYIKVDPIFTDVLHFIPKMPGH